MLDDTTAKLIGVLVCVLFCGFLIKCSVQEREDCARRKCVTGTPTWMIRESKGQTDNSHKPYGGQVQPLQ